MSRVVAVFFFIFANLNLLLFATLVAVTEVELLKVPTMHEMWKHYTVGMQKGAIFTIVFNSLLIELNIKFYEIFAK